MRSAKKILILIDHYLPAVNYGGPLRSVSAIVENLKSNYYIYILTSDRDKGDNLSFENIEIDEWLEKDGYKIKYCSPKKIKPSIAAEVKKPYHKIYLNSFFSKSFTIHALRCIDKTKRKSVVLAPRGMLAKGALSQKKHKKMFFLTIAKLSGLYKDIIWQASSELEKKDILNQFSNAKIKVLQNLSNIKPQRNVNLSNSSNQVKLTTIARISPEKNLKFILEVLCLVKCNYIFDVYGPFFDKNYAEECKKIVEENNLNVNFKGKIEFNEVANILKEYDLFVMSTLGENFGHSIIESLAMSVPVLISDKTIWSEINTCNAGKALSLTEKKAWILWIEYFSALQLSKRTEMRESAYNFACKILKSENLIAQHKKMFD